MIPREIVKKICQIELRTNRLVTETLGGHYHSGFRQAASRETNSTISVTKSTFSP